MEGNEPTGLLWQQARNRPAQVHSTSTARWRKCHHLFSQVDGLIGRRWLKSVLSSARFFADSTKNFRHRHRRHRRRWVYASCERHGSNKQTLNNYNHPKIGQPLSMEMFYSRLLCAHDYSPNLSPHNMDLSSGYSCNSLMHRHRCTIHYHCQSYHTIPKGWVDKFPPENRNAQNHYK